VLGSPHGYLNRASQARVLPGGRKALKSARELFVAGIRLTMPTAGTPEPQCPRPSDDGREEDPEGQWQCRHGNRCGACVEANIIEVDL
jgi:hypothetical protein